MAMLDTPALAKEMAVERPMPLLSPVISTVLLELPSLLVEGAMNG